MARTININFDQVLFGLVCLYAFFIPLEQILEAYFGIDTVLKPYRVVALLIIGIFAIKLAFRRSVNPQMRQDQFLYFIFGYGIIITLVRMMTTQFYMSYLLNDVFQQGMYLMVFIIMRHINLSADKLRTIVRWLGAGIIYNALYSFYVFHILKEYRRIGGLMDNPNYLALSIVVLMLLLVVEYGTLRHWFKKVLWWATMLLAIYVLVLAGSRTSLMVLIGALFFLLLLTPARDKIRLMVVGIVVAIVIGVGGLTVLDENTPLSLINRINEKRSEDDPRLAIWKGAYNAAQQSNFLGVGTGQFKGNFGKYYKGENNDLIRRIVQRNYFLSPHSDYFSILVVYGAFGLVSYLVFLFLSGRSMLAAYQRATNPEHKQHYKFALLVFSALVMFGFAHESLGSAFFWIVLNIGTKVELT